MVRVVGCGVVWGVAERFGFAVWFGGDGVVGVFGIVFGMLFGRLVRACGLV